MKAPVCRLCEHAHWNNEPHVFATNEDAATNGATNITAEAIVAAAKEIKQVPAFPALVVGPKTKNRRARGAYNAYQREYMRQRRANGQA